MMVRDMKLIAGALEHYVNDNPGNSPPEEIERVRDLATDFWAKAEEKQASETCPNWRAGTRRCNCRVCRERRRGKKAADKSQHPEINR